MNKTVYILFLLFFTSCIKELPLDLDHHVSKIVVNSFFSPNDSLRVHISKSIPILNNDTLTYIANATVELSTNDSFIGELTYSQKGFYTLPIALEAQKEYSIVVSAPDMKAVSSNNIIPIAVPILSFDTISINEKYLYCEISFQDLAEISNYYLLEVTSKNPVQSNNSTTHQMPIIISDNIVENGNSGDIRKRIFFSDKLIDGTAYDFSFVLNKERILDALIDGSNTVYINFKSISKAYYTYAKTYYESQNRQMDVFTNIENGYGIFAGFTVSQDSIVL